jgi:hypothetical protein
MAYYRVKCNRSITTDYDDDGDDEDDDGIFKIVNHLWFFIHTVTVVISCAQGWIQVLCSLKLIQFLGPSSRRRIQNYKYKIRYKSEYLFRAPARALEGALANDGH